jgi:hypothetical protein
MPLKDELGQAPPTIEDGSHVGDSASVPEERDYSPRTTASFNISQVQSRYQGKAIVNETDHPKAMGAISNQLTYTYTTRDEREASIPGQEGDMNRTSEVDRGLMSRKLIFFKSETNGIQSETDDAGSIPDSQFKRQVRNELRAG